MVRSFASLYPFRSHWLEVAGGRLHYLDEGPKDAPALLLLHGNPTWSFYWRTLIGPLAERYRVVVPDHLGCGLSDKPQDWSYTLAAHVANVRALAAHLGLEDLTLVMHDWGGAIGMGLAVEEPQRIARLAVMNTAAFPAAKMPLSIGLCRIPGVGALAIRGLNGFVRGALWRCVTHRERLTPEVVAGYLAPYDSWANRVANLRFVQDIPMSPKHPSHALLVRMGEASERLADRPMLIVWGGRDFVFDDWFYEEWRRRFPHAEAHYFADAGHWVVEDAHERIAPLLGALMEVRA